MSLAGTPSDAPDLPGVARAPFAAGSGVPSAPGARPDVWWGTVTRCAHWAVPLAVDVLGPEEQDRARRLVHETDRTTYTVSHVVLRLLLARERPGAEPSELSLDRAPCPSCGGPHGRPVLEGGPEFSLSHTNGAFAVAIALRPVGVDLERTHDPAVVREVSGSLHPRERLEIAEHPPDGRAAAFARAWTRKESFLKALGTGLSRDLAADDVGAGRAPRSPRAGWELADLALPEPFTGAVSWSSAPSDGASR